MAFPLGTLLSSTLLFFFLVALFPLLPHHVNANSWIHAAPNVASGVVMRNKVASSKPEHHRPKFHPGPWRDAHATFYEGDPGSFGGACGYEDVVKDGYGLDTAAVSTVLFQEGRTCGACYEMKCVDSPEWCTSQESIFVTATNLCPPNFAQGNDAGGWCNPPREHFDLAKPAYLKIAQYKGGIVPVQYRRVSCARSGGIRFTVTGNPYFNLVKVWNVGGAGDITSLQVKGGKNLKWTELKRNWGQKWETNAMLQGESLTFRVKASDGRFSTAWHIAPKDWQFGQTFESKKNFP